MTTPDYFAPIPGKWKVFPIKSNGDPIKGVAPVYVQAKTREGAARTGQYWLAVFKQPHRHVLALPLCPKDLPVTPIDRSPRT